MEKFLSIQNKILHNLNKVIAFLIIFYLVGIVGLSIPVTFPIFVKLIPLALLLSTFILFLFHRDFSKKAMIIFALIYVLGFFIEATGVNTGLIFGSYVYGESLSLKWLETPFMIGLNWLLLTYLANSVTDKLKIHETFKIFLSASILIIYDLVLERVAPVLDMWSWTAETVPVKNYIAWFVIALIFSAMLKFSGINLKNKVAPTLLICQILFFAILVLTL